MKSAFVRCLSFRNFLLACNLVLTIASFDRAIAQSPPGTGWPHIKYAIYFTSTDVDSLLADPNQFKKTMEYFAPVKPVHVYLEGTGRGEINVALLKRTAERFREMGIRVSGAMVPTGQRGPSVYNNPRDMAA